MSKKVSQIRIQKLDGQAKRTAFDNLAGEEPLRIQIQTPSGERTTITTTMRTPGDDFNLAVGTLYSAGIIDADLVHSVKYCTDVPENEQWYNVVTVTLRGLPLRRVTPEFRPRTSACGLCGSSEIETLVGSLGRVEDSVRISKEELYGLPTRLARGQRLFQDTGGVHAVGLFQSGAPDVISEDIGRHNAFDKAIGNMLTYKRNLSGLIAVLSGRVGFEMVQKAGSIGAEMIVAVSAPTSMAAEACDRLGITLVGFTRQTSANLYTAPQRVID
ncbi:MAG: formate dehydrogenase accessory sulfurtransferase FdhD [Acidimicrobiaceae bacterium]|nr:formate dehydrogenase accessory sulfurtransferase FdhD [Acidimicrobiaceae bacterium]